ncbi:hypothetical protein B0T18DRAFT_392599 [Schizothecium vesticola]|uniref:Galactose oxidase n=1 Tax=Schizothecium vesticola TaxID=314040 RepID=A0AA40K2V7_9PEZI|nr:hypothetical protein B0T18DRAFT_392599 [Schizothecium vesticola]
MAMTSLLLLSPTTTAAASLPYIPTSILLPPGSSTAFILSPNDATSSLDLLSIDLSSPLSPATFQPHQLSTSLPFFPRGATNIAFTPSVLANGTIAVFAGDCSVSTSAALWTYTPNTAGIWTRHTTSPGASWDYSQGGPYHLGGSVAFSQQLAPVTSPATFYIYGGMCPATTSSSVAGWEQQAATYSNRMLRLTPPKSGTPGGYTVSYAPSTGPPVAEAGFTLTALAPSMSNRSGIVTQQAGHVLLGGHTQQAFINMSTAAIWSLPEEQWSFVGIASPGKGGTDLAVKVDSRSGHTAVLSEDGTRLVVYGGWVGDVATPAEPQLAVVNIGAAFGDWKWEVPSGGGQPGSSGVYGHGAALLPGNVMMAYGGRSISGKKGKRAGEGVRFFDINKMTWTEGYTPPAAGSGSSAGGKAGTNPDGTPKSGGTPNSSGGGGAGGAGTSGSSPEGRPSSSEKSNLPLTLGLTLGLALPLLLAALLAIACLVRRRSRRRAQRDEALSNLAQGLPAHGYGHHRASGSAGSSGDMIQRSSPDDDIFMPWNAASARDWYTGGGDAYSQGRRSLGFETLRRQDNYGVDVPPPLFTPGVGTQQRPRTTVAKGLYTPTLNTGGGGSGYDFLPLRGPGGKNEIHPIYEEDDEDGDDLVSPNRKSILVDNDDPFATPPAARSPTHGPSSSAQDPEVRGWVSEVDAADAVLVSKIARHGSTTTTPPRFSPQGGGDDRTNSNLSDRSAFSFVAGAEGRLAHRPGTGGTSSGASFSTAKSTFAALQSEGPDLLLRPHYQQQQTPTQNNFDLHHEDSEEEEFPRLPPSPSKSKPRRSLSGGAAHWLGSLKRVFSNPSPDPSSSEGHSRTRESLLDGSNASSTDFDAAAAGRALLARTRRRKQGREAWEGGHAGEDGDGDEEWDVERAVEQSTAGTTDKEEEEEEEEEEDGRGREREGLLLRPDGGVIHNPKRRSVVAAGEGDGLLGLSPSPSLRTSSITTNTCIQMAEEVRLERPIKTRVLKMVESIESRGSSPGGSPVRSG